MADDYLQLKNFLGYSDCRSPRLTAVCYYLGAFDPSLARVVCSFALSTLARLSRPTFLILHPTILQETQQPFRLSGS